MLKLFVVACTLALAGSAGAASVRPLALDEIIGTATIAFQGTCIGNRTEREETTNFVVTYTTFVVTDVLKGTVPGTHVIKQIGGKMPAGEPSFHADGVPTFVVGEDYVVFLAGVSAAGFSSPIGLEEFKQLVRARREGLMNDRTVRLAAALLALAATGAQAGGPPGTRSRISQVYDR